MGLVQPKYFIVVNGVADFTLEHVLPGQIDLPISVASVVTLSENLLLIFRLFPH